MTARPASTTASPPRTTAAPRTRSLAETVPPYRVVLHNDDVNDMGHVVRALLESVPELTSERAREVIREAHEHGMAEVIRCPQERAEFYRDRLQGFGLAAAIEPV